MSHFFFYATEQDGELIRAWLNSEPDIAWIVPEAPGRWKALHAVPRIAAGGHTLWHVPSGPLPLFAALDDRRPRPIEDPWSGWTALVSGRDPDSPWFGQHPGVLGLGFWPRGNPGEQGQDSPNYLGVSHFGWIGDHFRTIGRSAHPATKRWWARLRRWVAKVAVKVTGAVPTNSPPLPIMAFPDAFRLIEGGEARRYESHYRRA